jgi:hypothetical protein
MAIERYWFEKLEQEILSAAEGRFMQKLLRFCG